MLILPYSPLESLNAPPCPPHYSRIPPTWAKPGATARLETAFSTEAGLLGEGT
ncbi:hypothetical protein PspLS_08153 [Pyricularia sp. CBS 133598]|nr:hypothetical protein PspLS_08153 [Pyricularia sp. CBS 133598]